MFAIQHAKGKLRRWARRAVITLLIAMITGISASAGFIAWVIWTTMPVVVLEERGRPVSGVVVFDLNQALAGGSTVPRTSSVGNTGQLAGEAHFY